MENIIILLLFTYPGAVAYYVYSLLAHDKTFYHEADSFYRTAACFFLSAMATALSMLTLSPFTKTNSLIALVDQLKGDSIVYAYIFVSFVASVLLGIALYGIANLIFYLRNQDRKMSGDSQKGSYAIVWDDMMNNFEIQNCALLVWKNKELICAGLPEILPSDYSKDKHIVLSFCDRVEAELEKPNRGLLGDHYISFFDADTGFEYEFIESMAFDKVLKEEITSG